LEDALNYFKSIIRLLISSTSWLLGFSDANIIDSLLNDIVVNLLSSGSREGHINITSFSLFFLGEIIGLTHERNKNQLIWANNSCRP